MSNYSTAEFREEIRGTPTVHFNRFQLTLLGIIVGEILGYIVAAFCSSALIEGFKNRMLLSAKLGVPLGSVAGAILASLFGRTSSQLERMDAQIEQADAGLQSRRKLGARNGSVLGLILSPLGFFIFTVVYWDSILANPAYTKDVALIATIGGMLFLAFFGGSTGWGIGRVYARHIANLSRLFCIGAILVLLGTIGWEYEFLVHAQNPANFPGAKDFLKPTGTFHQSAGTTSFYIIREPFLLALLSLPLVVVIWQPCKHLIRDLLHRLFSAFPTRERRAQRLCEEAYTDFLSEQLMRKAERKLKKAIRLKPEFPEAYYNLGILYMDSLRLYEAEDAFKMAIKYRPNYAEAYSNLGDVYANLGLWEKAINFYEKALSYNPNSVPAQQGLELARRTQAEGSDACPAAELLLKQAGDELISGHYNEAIEKLEMALKLRPRNPALQVAIYYNQGKIWEKRRNFRKMRELLETAVSVDQTSAFAAVAFNDLGIAYGKLGDEEKACLAFEKALDIKPDYTLAWYNLYASYQRRGLFVQAISVLERMNQLHPEGGSLDEMRARDIIQMFEPDLTQSPDDDELRFLLGRAYLQLNRNEEAITALRKAVSLRERPLYYVELGKALKRTEQLEESKEAFESALRFDPSNQEARQNLDSLNSKKGKNEG